LAENVGRKGFSTLRQFCTGAHATYDLKVHNLNIIAYNITGI